MASASKPILTTGVAIASAVAIVAATPALMSNPGPEVHIAAPTVMAPVRHLTVADIQLLNTFSLAGLGNAVFNGYGGIVTGTTPDPTGFLCGEEAKCTSYVVGAAYYLTDTLLLPNTSLDNHLFEQGLITGLVEFVRESVPESNKVANAVLDSILQPLRAPVYFSEALLGEFSPVTQFLKALWDGGLVGVIKFVLNGPEPAPPPEDEVTLLSKTNAGGVQTLDASLAPEAGTSAVGTFKAPDLSKLVSLPVKPLEKKVEDNVKGGDTLTVDTTAVDTTDVQDPPTGGGTVETVETVDPPTGGGTVETVDTVDPTGEDSTVETVKTADPTSEDSTVETVKTEKPKLNVKKFNPLAGLKGGDPILPVTSKDGSSEAPQSALTKAIKKFVGGFGKHQKDEGTGTGAAAADNGGGGETGGGDAG